ncbi:recombinase family protein [Thalassoporum mexicanum]|uniref:recombinase family protein n=1 Tax=Thalassoporum mexicanum TaxID=3457544 RepID=UPI00030C2F6D|nr:recombinase family protein [Pseudanabaena sp. PCC 7367]
MYLLTHLYYAASGGELDPLEIKRHRRSGKSFRAIADYLNRNNYPTKRGGNWTHRTVKLILDRTKVKSA